MNCCDEDGLARKVEQFLYEEAAVLDERKFEEWLGLFAKDVRYLVPIRTTRAARDPRSEFSGDRELAHIDDDISGLTARVRRLRTGFAWAEDPPSRTRHFVSNVRVRKISEVEVEADCNLLVYRGRLDRQQDIFCGKRVDRLRVCDRQPGLEITVRTVYLDHTLLFANGISIFF